MSLSSTSKVLVSKAKQPRQKTPPKAYVRDHDDSDDSSDEDNRTPSVSEQDNTGYRSDPSTEKADSGEDGAATNKAKKKRRVYEYSLTSTARRQQQVERIDDGDDPRSTQQTVNRESPLALWKTIDESMKQVKVEKTAVHDFVANYLFPKLKFVRGNVGSKHGLLYGYKKLVCIGDVRMPSGALSGRNDLVGDCTKTNHPRNKAPKE